MLKFTLEINIFSLIAFLSGIFAGFVILGLIYFIGCLRSITKKKNKINKIINEISQEEIKEINNISREGMIYAGRYLILPIYEKIEAI